LPRVDKAGNQLIRTDRPTRSERRTVMKRSIVLFLAVAAAAIGTTAGAASDSPRGRPLHVTKNCGHYNGTVGSFCTIASSNIAAIEQGMNVVYLASMPPNLVLDSDLVLSSGNGGAAVGHVVLDLSTKTGRVTFSAGSGTFRHFRADVVVSQDPKDPEVWHWDGRYWNAGLGDDD
jgi:hypothetical protein